MSDDTPAGDTEPAPQAEEPAAAAGEPTPEPAIAEPVTAESVVAPAAAAAAPPPEGRGGILLPTWVAVVLAVLLIGGVGFAIGYWTGDDGDSDERNADSGQTVPNRQGPFGNVPGNNLPNRGTPPNGNGNNGNGQTTAQTAFLGVSVESADNSGGARVTSVQSTSPAASAGLKTGDVITKVGDTNIQSDADLIRAIRNHEPGDEVTITYTRDGNSAQAKVTLGNRSDATRSSVPS
ncbi:MAG: PDZ domain-containing protein [Acidimicrobiia bacterium]